ncbi:MAG: UDP-N-acetylglucosamine 2-epimerase [Minisyncoccia bacterium]|jgi:UDP-hydrolysing UDP-N-acetyl-D-glucosamine 2-epimerase
MSTKQSKKKILVVTGTRAEYGYLRPVLQEIKRSSKLELRLLVTGMHTLKKFGYTIDDIKKDEMPITAVVPIREQDTMLQALAKEIKGIEKCCTRERPDLMLVIADRDEPFAAAIVAGHLGIPVVHLSGGDTSGFGVDEPIRHSISKFAHVHFAWTHTNAARLRAMGEEPWRVQVSGSTSFDTLRELPFLNRIDLAKKFGLDEDKSWILAVQHPTPLDRVPLTKQFGPTLAALKRFDAEKIIIYPNSDTGSELFVKALDALRGKPQYHLYRSLPHRDYLALLKHSQAMVGNSSSGMAEAGYFKTPVVDIGNRQKGREHGGNVMHVPYSKNEIIKAIRRALSAEFVSIAKKSKHPYDYGNASKKIVKVLERLRIDEKLMYKQVPLT